MKLNLGCGSNVLDGWDNHDADVDITKPLPFGDACAEQILAEHVVEHTTHPDALRFFDEAFRVLVPGGTLRICLPVLDRLETDHARDIVFGHGHLSAWNPMLLSKMMMLAGFKTSISERKECDGHWRAIGTEKDDLETCRVDGTKPN